MNNLLKTKLFNLLMNGSQTVINEEMQSAYGKFIVEMISLNQSDKDYQLIYRSLNLTRIEFQSLQAQISYEQGENALKNLYLQKAISVIEHELILLETRFTHPQRFAKEQTFKSDLYIIPKSKDLGIVAFAEIVEGLYLSQEVLSKDSKPASKTQIGHIFELMFDMSFGNISDKTSEIYKRKPEPTIFILIVNSFLICVSNSS